jgi:hypothetical protein
MFLSNPSKTCIGFFVLAFVLAGCRWWGEAGLPAPIAAEPKSGMPFSSKEPDTYQAFLITSVAGKEEKRFVAHSGSKWRLDIYDGDVIRSSVVESGERTLIDHRRKVFTKSDGTQAAGAEPEFLQDITLELLRQRKYTKFEDLGLENGVRRYRATTGDGDSSESILYYDESAGIIVRQEFVSSGELGGRSSAQFTIELRDLKLNVADDVFNIPAGYRGVSQKEFHSGQK